MRLILLFILIIFTVTSFGQNSKDSLQFSIYFTECFKKDTVSLSLNGVPIFQNKNLTTRLELGLANIYIHQDENNLWLNSNEKLSKLNIKDTLHLDILLNRHLEKIKIDIKQGKYILLNKCPKTANDLAYGKLTMKQLKTQPEFD